MLRPVLQAQTEAGLDNGYSQHSGKGLVSKSDMLRANAAKHAAFHKEKPLSKLPDQELKKFQRGKSHLKHKDALSDLIGTWSSSSNEEPKVLRTPLGVFASFSPDDAKLHKIELKDRRVWINGCQMIEHTGDTVRWIEGKTEVIWTKVTDSVMRGST